MRLLLDKGAAVDRAEKYGRTPLWVACGEGHVDLARLLLDKGADVNKADEDGYKPLSIADSRNHSGSHSAIIELLGGQTRSRWA